MYRISIGCPVRQRPAILAPFLSSLAEVDSTNLELSYAFVDDNEHSESSALLESFAAQQPRASIDAVLADRAQYACDDETHHWNPSLVWKVARFKDQMIARARAGQYDALFLVDSDVLVPPALLRHLAQLEKPVVSEVFWTQWQPTLPMLPQVWVSDHYTLFPRGREESALTQEEASRRTLAFLKQLRRPGTYRVGGLGACTLISRASLEAGVASSRSTTSPYPVRIVTSAFVPEPSRSSSGPTHRIHPSTCIERLTWRASPSGDVESERATSASLG